MADDHYDAGSEDEPKDKPDSSESKDEKDDNEALLPKSFFRNKEDLKVGAIEKIKITHMYDDEVSAVCVYGDKKESKDEENDGDSAEMADSMKSMDGMAV